MSQKRDDKQHGATRDSAQKYDDQSIEPEGEALSEQELDQVSGGAYDLNPNDVALKEIGMPPTGRIGMPPTVKRRS